MDQIGKVIIIAGVALVLVGLAVWGLGKLGFHGLPGDVKFQSDHVTIYFPIVTCLVLSVVLTLLFWLIRWLNGGG
jgi:Protein of unknown function (DUF2905)